MKDEQGGHASRVSSTDVFIHQVHADPSDATPGPHVHVSEGEVLWTLTQHQSTAQARRWRTASGFELELQIWTGVRVVGQEDLCWTQLFPSDAALGEAALAKKQQLEASGWLEELDTTAR